MTITASIIYRYARRRRGAGIVTRDGGEELVGGEGAGAEAEAREPVQPQPRHPAQHRRVLRGACARARVCACACVCARGGRRGGGGGNPSVDWIKQTGDGGERSKGGE